VRLAANAARYFLTHRGPLATGAYDAGAWFKTHPELARPDAQILIAPFSINYASAQVAPESHGGMNFCVYSLRPSSKGSVAIRSRNPKDLVEIRPGYGTDSSDATKMVEIIRYTRRMVKQPPLAELVIEETRPGPKYQSDVELLAAHLQYGYGNYHACGTCRMGRDDASVVDPALRVRGVEGLRVVDTSIFPFMLSGNTNGPAMATAWRAADLIIGHS
jgi:choline dehydrogenase-like flavoprotein